MRILAWIVSDLLLAAGGFILGWFVARSWWGDEDE